MIVGRIAAGNEREEDDRPRDGTLLDLAHVPLLLKGRVRGSES
jgi:hypothetical protein